MKKVPFTLEMKQQRAHSGRAGGKARARALTKKQRLEIAIKASRAAAVARTAKAKL
jgi:hypothetical protein